MILLSSNLSMTNVRTSEIQLIDLDGSVDLTSIEELSPHTVAGIIKLFFRELPEVSVSTTSPLTHFKAHHSIQKLSSTLVRDK
jgi:hypothetical protein